MSLRMREARAHRRVLVPERLRRHLDPWLDDIPSVEDHLVVLPPDGWEGVDCPAVTGAVLWSWTPDELAREVLDRCPRVRWIHSTWTGVEHLPLREISDRRITLTTAGEVVARPLAEWVASAILWRAKEIRALERNQQAHLWEAVQNEDMEGLRILLLGLGTIGTEVSRVLRSFHVEMTAVRASTRPAPLVQRVLPPERLAEAAREADVLVISVPLTPATRGMVDRQVLAALPDGSGVVNIARGEVVDEAALLDELTGGRLWAALDVFSTEPLPEDSPLWDLPNVLVSPHSAHTSPHHRDAHVGLIWDLLIRHITADRLHGTVSRAAMERYLGA